MQKIITVVSLAMLLLSAGCDVWRLDSQTIQDYLDGKSFPEPKRFCEGSEGVAGDGLCAECESCTVKDCWADQRCRPCSSDEKYAGPRSGQCGDTPHENCADTDCGVPFEACHGYQTWCKSLSHRSDESDAASGSGDGVGGAGGFGVGGAGGFSESSNFGN